MDWPSLLAIAVALAMDAFAVAIAAGLALNALTKRHLFRLGFHLGLFQALMFTIGWLLGSATRSYVAPVDHWLAFGLLALVGTKVIRGGLRGDKGKGGVPDPTSGWELVGLSLATSMDALAVGLSLAVIGGAIVPCALVIGLVAACLTLLGMVLGRRIGALWGRRVEVLGGITLIAIGIKIVLEHTRAQ
jgi:putative Mn2+ efflux pump MntP